MKSTEIDAALCQAILPTANSLIEKLGELNNSTPKLIMLYGVSGSGKSTLAAVIQQELASRGSESEICEADHYFYSSGQYQWDGEKLQDAHAACRAKVKETLKANKTAIVSNTNITPKERKPYFIMALENDATLAVHLCEGEFESLHAPKHAVERQKERFVHLSQQELEKAEAEFMAQGKTPAKKKDLRLSVRLSEDGLTRLTGFQHLLTGGRYQDAEPSIGVSPAINFAVTQLHSQLLSHARLLHPLFGIVSAMGMNGYWTQELNFELSVYPQMLVDTMIYDEQALLALAQSEFDLKTVREAIAALTPDDCLALFYQAQQFWERDNETLVEAVHEAWNNHREAVGRSEDEAMERFNTMTSSLQAAGIL